MEKRPEVSKSYKNLAKIHHIYLKIYKITKSKLLIVEIKYFQNLNLTVKISYYLKMLLNNSKMVTKRYFN